jgi:hypothetical protein
MTRVYLWLLPMILATVTVMLALCAGCKRG